MPVDRRDAREVFADFVRAAEFSREARRRAALNDCVLEVGTLLTVDRKLAVEFLTDYSEMQVEKARDAWEELANALLVKFNDGYTRDENGKYPNVGYPDQWLRRVVKEKGDQFLLPDEEE